jgi:hypothetical protein
MGNIEAVRSMSIDVNLLKKENIGSGIPQEICYL